MLNPIRIIRTRIPHPIHFPHINITRTPFAAEFAGVRILVLVKNAVVDQFLEQIRSGPIDLLTLPRCRLAIGI